MEFWYPGFRAMLFGERVVAAAPTTAGKALRKVDMSDGGNGEVRKGEEERWYSRATFLGGQEKEGPWLCQSVSLK